MSHQQTEQQQNAQAQPLTSNNRCPHHCRVNIIRPNLHQTLQGYVHLATLNNKYIIIKQTSKSLVNTKLGYTGNQIEEDFLEERRILQKLSKQNDIKDKGICTIYNVWEDNNNYYYSMNYCQQELFHYINNKYQYFKNNQNIAKIMQYHKSKNIPYKPWSNQIQYIFKQIVTSVAYLHSKGISHMDLSLENIMLNVDTNGNIITDLIDFGVAHDISVHNGSWISSKRVGKIGYIAPEVFEKDYKYDCRSADIWSLGVLLYIMLAGAPPYRRPVVVKHKYNKNDTINKFLANNGDVLFTYLIQGQLENLLIHQNLRWMFSDSAVDLLKKIFKLETNRITMNEILSHPFIVGVDRDIDANNKVLSTSSHSVVQNSGSTVNNVPVSKSNPLCVKKVANPDQDPNKSYFTQTHYGYDKNKAFIKNAN